MTNVLYPLGLIEQLKVTPSTRVLSDVFEDGSTNTRLLYPAQNFKRHFVLQHAPLTLDEYRFLRSFHSQRGGLYDAFWFRDNVNRAGNARVRFAKPLPEEHNGVLFNTQTEMDEVAAIRGNQQCFVGLELRGKVSYRRDGVSWVEEHKPTELVVVPRRIQSAIRLFVSRKTNGQNHMIEIQHRRELRHHHAPAAVDEHVIRFNTDFP